MERVVKLCLLILALTVLVSGCATSRAVLNLQVPADNITNPNGKQVYIRSITDNRQFQDNPPSADIPSLGFGGMAKATPELKSRAIGRKRGGFGKALGDIVLEEGQTVEDIISKSTKNALYSLGYVVVDKQEEAKPDAIVLNISIDKFWTWLVPGFWALSLNSEITTTNTLVVPKKGEPIIIKAAATNRVQAATDGNWKKVIDKVIDDFIENAKTRLKDLDARKEAL